MDPARKEASPAQHKCCVCSNNQSRDCVRGKEDSGKVFDSYFNDALQYCDRMLRYELLESDKEGALKGDGALDESQARARKKGLARELQGNEAAIHVRS